MQHLLSSLMYCYLIACNNVIWDKIGEPYDDLYSIDWKIKG